MKGQQPWQSRPTEHVRAILGHGGLWQCQKEPGLGPIGWLRGMLAVTAGRVQEEAWFASLSSQNPRYPQSELLLVWAPTLPPNRQELRAPKLWV